MFHRGGPGKPKGFGFGGFQLGASKKAEIPPPPSFTSTSSFKTGPGLSKQGYATMNSIQHNAQDMPYGVPRKRPKTEEEYFEQDDEEEPRTGSSSLAYIPAPGSPAAQENKEDSESASDDSDGEEDPLDAFMAGIEKQVKKDVLKSDRNERGVRDDIEMEDDEESYYRYMEENPNAGLQQDDSDNEMEYDEDGNPVAPTRSKYIDPLPFFDHSTHTYQSFEKNFYDEHEDISKLTAIEVDELRQALSLKVSGACPPKPVTSFGHFGFDEALMKSVRKSDYTQPTPIQAQGVPIAMNGRDLIGIAKTGSGKTAAFIWPMLIHIMDQKNLEPGEGPIGLILAPTRELALQIHTEAKRFGKVYNVRVVCCYGGGSKWEQTKALQDGAEIVVATPGRMIDLIKAKATNLHRVTFLVLDEADRMFDMGFEPQVRSICDHCRPDRQTLMFSATFRRKVERLARDALTDPVRVVQGETGEANEDVTQVVLLMKTPEIKWGWLTQRLVQFLTTGSVLIFVTKKANAEELCNNLKTKDFEALLLHGDMDQTDRSQVITAFRKKEVPIMVATDVAARGLDIPHIRTVVNYDVARDIDTHTHRVGRTGRAGEKGLAYTLVTEKDKEFAGHLVRNLEGANQPVPSELMDLAMQSGWFRKSRFKGGKGKKLIGKGLGFKERPGLGCIQGSASSTQTMTSSPSELARVGPQSDRITAMKAAFKAQYSQQFCQASSASMESTSTVTPDRFKPPAAPDNPRQPPSAPDNPPVVKERDRTRKKSRWDS